MKKCPPGVICLENVTMFFIFVVILVLVYFLYTQFQKQGTGQQQTMLVQGVAPSYPYTNFPSSFGSFGGFNFFGPKDVLEDPYAPPLKDERYFVPQVTAVPINVSTNVGAVDTNYRQIGIITPLNGESKDNILPLMGRPLFTNRNKWQYYTISNQHNNVKLPILFKGRSALNEYGVDQIFQGDTVYVEGYNEPFATTVYETDTIKYLPYL